MTFPVTPDGRYFVAKSRLWRCTEPSVSDAARVAWTRDLMQVRSAVRRARTPEAMTAARARVHEAKVRLGERGPVWWDDGAEDVNRHHPKNTVSAGW